MTTNNMKLFPVILSGGSGTRLWPVSREQHPKPFIKLPDGDSLLQKAFVRAASLSNIQEVITVTNKELFFISNDEYNCVNTQNHATSFILEPVGRNTAAAISIASLYACQKDEDAVLVVFPSDHLITDQSSFSFAVDNAVALAEKNKIVTFGIQPTCPETGYGYIEANGNDVIKFIEKPTLKKAEEYLSQGNYFWNSGMFCFKARTMLDELRTHAPELLKRTETCFKNSQEQQDGSISQIQIPLESFELVDDISIDYAVIEKTNRLAVVACDIGWNDIGSWNAFSDIHNADDAGNQINGHAELFNVKNSFVHSDKRMLAAVGVENLLIIDTADALLVADKKCAQDVKQIVGQLKIDGHASHKVHSTVHRPWGTYTILEEGPGFKIKRIVVKPGATLSLQMHHHRSEHWVVVSGTAKVVNGDEIYTVIANESTYIPAGDKHRLENPGKDDLVMIEVQCGNYLGEDDIVRFDDKYGRN